MDAAALETLARRFADALAAADAEALAACVSPDVRLRAVIPPGCVERTGRDAVDALRSWFDVPRASVEWVRSEQVSDRARVSYRIAVETDGGPAVMEQWSFWDVGEEVIEGIDLVCSGRRPVLAAAGDVHAFDAGEMGCADGLSQEFKRRLRAIPVGDVLRVVTRDASAKEDLPSLARLMGQRIESVETLGDGRLEITVERVR